MTNEELFDDLKQFITATVSQSEERLTDRIDGVERRVDGIEQRMVSKDDLERVEQRLTARMDGLERKIEDVQAGVGDAITQLTEHVDERFDDHEQRFRRLEQRAA